MSNRNRIQQSVYAILLSAALAATQPLPAIAMESHEFAVETSDPARAIQDFADQSGLQILASVEQLQGKKLQSVTGKLSTEEGLQALLDGTGLFHQYVGERTVALVKPEETTSDVTSPAGAGVHGANVLRLAQAVQASSATSTEVSATDRASADSSEQSLLPLAEVTVFGRGVATRTRDIPQTVNVLDREFIENVQAVTISDVVRFTPNAIPYGVSTALFDDVRTRGFPTSFTWNGMARRGVGGTLKLANVERVEVLKGPASVLYGSMEPGAVVNMVTKRPQHAFAASGKLEYGSNDEQQYGVDLGGPVSERIGARLNATYYRTDTSFQNAGLNDLFVAPVVEFQLAEHTLLTLDGYYDRADWPEAYVDGRVPVVGGLLPNPHGKIPRRANLQYDENITAPDGYGDLDTLLTDVDANARLSHEFSDALSINLAYSYHRSRTDREQIYDSGLNADSRTLRRSYEIQQGIDESTDIAHADLKWSFKTAGLSHQVAVGFDYTNTDFEGQYATMGITPIDIFNPVYGTIVLPAVIPFDDDSGGSKISEVFFQDRVSLGRVHLLAGARHTDYESVDDYQAFEGDLYATELEDQIWSTQFGLLYDAADWLTLFASRNESFVPRLATIFGRGTVAQPERGIQYELGAKFALGSSGFSGNAVFFHIEKNDLLVLDPEHVGFSVPLGGVESKGFELSVEGSPVAGLSLYFGYGYNPTEITKADRNVGNSFFNVPKQTFSAYVNYQVQGGILQGIAFTSSLQYVGQRWASDDNAIEWPAYTRLDIGATYEVSDHMEVGLNIRNVLESAIYTGFGNFRVTRDPFRTVLGTVTYQF